MATMQTMVRVAIKTTLSTLCFFILCTGVKASVGLTNDTPYLKQSSMEKFDGVWSVQNDSISFTLKLKLYAKVYSPGIDQYVDYLAGWYSYEKKNSGGVIREETLSRWNSDINITKALSGIEQPSDPKTLPTIAAYQLRDGTIRLNFRRVPSIGGPYYNMIGHLTETGDGKARITFRNGENFNTNHELDYMIEYLQQSALPAEMILERKNK